MRAALGRLRGALAPLARRGAHTAAPREVHPTAIIADGARLGDGVRIGPYCVIGPHAVLEEGVMLHSHVVVAGHTSIGARSTVFSFATVGAEPQDLKYRGERSELIVGRDCRIFEYAHLSGGTAGGGGATTIGDGCLLMSHVHVAHDCVIGERVILASHSALAGHVAVGNAAQVSGYACVHQRVSVGAGSFVGAASVLVADLLPYGLAVGNRAALAGLNLRGLRRARAPSDEVRAMLRAFRYTFGDASAGSVTYGPMALPHRECIAERAVEVQQATPQFARVAQMADFVLARQGRAAMRALCLPPQRDGADRRFTSRQQNSEAFHGSESHIGVTTLSDVQYPAH